MAFEPMAVLTAFAAAILDSGVRIGNRCKLFPVYALFRASILDFRPKLENRCKFFPGFGPGAASILDFKPRLANRCSTIVVAVKNGSHAAAVAATRFRVRFYSSLPQRRMVSPAAAVAATRSASVSILRCRKEEWFRLQRP